MSDIDPLKLFTQFSGFKVLVAANRLGCDNGLARTAHNRLIAKLNGLIELMGAALAAERNMLCDETSERYQNAAEDLYWIAEEFAARCLADDPVPLLDSLWIDWATREIFDAQTQRWRFYDDDGSGLDDVSDAELCGLRRIIDDIAAETGVRFSACRTVYDEAEVTPPHDDDPVEDPEGNPLWGPDTD